MLNQHCIDIFSHFRLYAEKKITRHEDWMIKTYLLAKLSNVLQIEFILYKLHHTVIG